MRQTWDETWMRVAEAVAGRSACVRGGKGAVIVDASQRIIATGYTGQPAGYPGGCATHCPRGMTEGEPSRTYDDCISAHAEANALLFCDRRDREGGTIYTTGLVCWECAKVIANSGLARVVMRDDGGQHRAPERSVELLRLSKLEVLTWQD